MSTLRCVTVTTLVLRGFRDQLVWWQAICQKQLQLLDSHDLDEYFMHHNNSRVFKLRDEVTRDCILNGKSFMVDKNSGEVILSETDVKNILAQYPGNLIRQRVNTVPVPEYKGFDSCGFMINSGSNRCYIKTICHEEMLRVCHQRDQHVPIDIQARRLKRVARTDDNQQEGAAKRRRRQGV
jgi:hypothetical protein